VSERCEGKKRGAIKKKKVYKNLPGGKVSYGPVRKTTYEKRGRHLKEITKTT